MTCNDCLHFEICEKILPLDSSAQEKPEYNKAEKLCDQFRDKAKMIEIPCNYGDTVYSIIDGGGVTRIRKSRCHSVRIGSPNSVWCYANDKVAAIHYFSDFGKTAFLTLEEAEDALRKIKEKKK